MANGADGRKPTRTILLPDGVPNDMPYRAVAVHCSSWAAESGCEIEPQWNRPVQFRGAVPRLLTGFHLYGTTSQADAAVRVINKWIESVRNKKYASWVKMKAFDPNKWYYDQVTEMENERKQKFKGQLPEEPLPFEVYFTFLTN